MKKTSGNGFKTQEVIEPPIADHSGQSNRPAETEIAGVKQPYVPEKTKPPRYFKDNARVLIIGGGIALVLLWLAIRGIPHQTSPRGKKLVQNRQELKSPDNSADPGSVVPLMDSGRRPEDVPDKNMVQPDQIARTAGKQAKPSPGSTLGAIPPFESSQPWQPAPYQPGLAAAADQSAKPQTPSVVTKTEHDSLDRASLVFIRTNTSTPEVPKARDSLPTA